MHLHIILLNGFELIDYEYVSMVDRWCKGMVHGIGMGMVVVVVQLWLRRDSTTTTATTTRCCSGCCCVHQQKLRIDEITVEKRKRES